MRYGYSPMKLMLTQPNRKCFSGQDGHVDALRALLLSDNFIKPYSEEHLLVNLSKNCAVLLKNLHVLCEMCVNLLRYVEVE